MFGKAGLGGLMKQAQQMQENMKKAQAKLAETEVEGEAGDEQRSGGLQNQWQLN